MKWQGLSPSQRLWAEIFGLKGIPELEESKVLGILSSLPPRQGQVVRLRFGFGGRPLSLERVGKKLTRANGRTGMSGEAARLLLGQSLRRLRHASLRSSWEAAKK